MTTAAQVKALVRPFVERHSDLALVGRWIFVRPVHHFARAILIDRTSDPEQFNPRYATIHLFEWRSSFSLSWGDYLYDERSSRPTIWRIKAPDVESSLFEQIETKALPMLRAMTTLDDYLRYVDQNYFRHQLFDWPECRIIVEVALGDLSAARKTSEAHRALWSDVVKRADDDGRQEFERVLQLSALLAADDRKGLAALLHEWEAATVKNLKIEHLWEPTPFPLELQASSA